MWRKTKQPTAVWIQGGAQVELGADTLALLRNLPGQTFFKIRQKMKGRNQNRSWEIILKAPRSEKSLGTATNHWFNWAEHWTNKKEQNGTLFENLIRLQILQGDKIYLAHLQQPLLSASLTPKSKSEAGHCSDWLLYHFNRAHKNTWAASAESNIFTCTLLLSTSKYFTVPKINYLEVPKTTWKYLHIPPNTKKYL